MTMESTKFECITCQDGGYLDISVHCDCSLGVFLELNDEYYPLIEEDLLDYDQYCYSSFDDDLEDDGIYWFQDIDDDFDYGSDYDYDYDLSDSDIYAL